MDDANRQSRDRQKRGHSIRPNLIMKAIFGANWKTTQAGIAVIGAAAALIGTALKDGFQITDVQALIEGFGGIAGGVGLIFARDRNVTSEQSGAK